jgi:CBS domain-containing protein
MITVKEILQKKGHQYFGLAPDAITYDALKLMAEKEIGAILVIKDDRIVGIFSERDYARKIVLKGKSSRNTKVSEFMSATVYAVNGDTTLDECMQLMTDRRIRHLPVVESEKIIGVLSIGDIVNCVIQEQKRTIEQLENYIITGL